MPYKLLILDLDGTTIPNKKDGMPSVRVVDVIHQIKDKVIICVATGRGIAMCRHILSRLGITALCIVNGGTRIIDPVTEKVLWEKELDHEQVREIMNVAKEYHYPVFFGDDLEGTSPQLKLINGGERIIYIEPVTREDTEIILQKLKHIPNITSHKVTSWTPDHFDIHITHAEATKRHALEILLEMLGVHKSEVVAIGDSENDLPLFEVAGFKVAMGNGADALKEQADLIAPPVSEDGLAVVLEKLFMQEK